VDNQDGSAVVVGGGSGIGAAVAGRYRELGVPVVVWDIAGDRDVTCDVSIPDDIDKALDRTLEVYGTPRWLTITAGIGHAALLADASPDDFDRVLHVNTRGVWLIMRALAGPMAEAGGGSIVAVSSISGRIADRGMGMYCASKAALDMLVRVAAVEWGETNVRVNAVAPGVTQTPMLGPVPTDSGWLAGVRQRTPLDRLGTADDIAEVITGVHGLDWVTGQIVDCDGGLALHSPINPGR
jgi:NAD(P)-dependent dehydrogenase (short-subunit alcohol dehydrogenase family)